MSQVQDLSIVAPPPVGSNGQKPAVYSMELEGDIYEEKVKIKGRGYILSELSGDDLARWLDFDAARSSARFDDSGKLVGEMNHDGYHATLISMCLKDMETGQKIGKETIKAWGSSTQLPLFHRCRDISGLSSTGLKKAKKD